MSEAEVAAQAQAVWRGEAGRRVPAILTVTTGEATSTGGWEATDRVIAGRRPRALRHLALDRRPLVGQRQRRLRRHAERPSSAASSTACAARSSSRSRSAGPGALACDVDTAVRAELADLGPTYPHHTGHGIGASWSEPPRITPYERIALEEGMVLAVEPAFYAAGFGGIRLEHTFVVRAGGNEILTRFEHTL